MLRWFYGKTICTEKKAKNGTYDIISKFHTIIVSRKKSSLFRLYVGCVIIMVNYNRTTIDKPGKRGS